MTRCASTGVVSALLVGFSLTTACAKSSPTEPGSTARSALPNIAVASMAAQAQALSSGGHTYRVIVKLRESGGAAATISSIDLTFLDGSTTLASSHHDRPISDAANVVPANGTVDSRELTTTDGDFSHPAATSVVARVAFTDGASTTSSATGSAQIPAPAPATYTLSGILRDESSARAIAGGTVQIVDGVNAGKSSATDLGGGYALSGLTGGSFVVRATANGYDPRQQSMGVTRDTTLDLTLRPISSAPPPPPSSSCSYTVAPSESGMDFNGGSLTATISRTSGTCSWQASSDVSWITFPGGASGNGSATLAYALGPNGLTLRVGRITIAWADGSAQIRVQQGPRPDWECFVSLGKGTQDFDNVPSAGGALTATALVSAIPAGWNGSCSGQVRASVPWISGGGDAFGGLPATFTFTVAPNPSPGTARSGSIVATVGAKTQTLAVTQR